MNLIAWSRVARIKFLPLSGLLVLLGGAMARQAGYVDPGRLALVALGLLAAHLAVNLFNEYFDFHSGIDQHTSRTPFSGGSGVLPEGKLKPRQVLTAAIFSLALTLGVGLHFCLRQGWELLPLLLLAAFLIIGYSPLILKSPWPEAAAGLGLGTLPLIGIFFVLGGGYSWRFALAAVPSGLLVHNLLLLNEFPDIEADRQGGRRTLPIRLGRPAAARFYLIIFMVAYGWLALAVGLGLMPMGVLLAMFSLPWTLAAALQTLRAGHQNLPEPALRNSATAVLLAHLLLGIGYLV